MPLLDLLRDSPDAVAGFSLSQVISVAGDGTLRDGSKCSAEFRSFLTRCPIARLESFINECLANGSKMGLALQDLVNELGRRLGYEAFDGRYQGIRGQIGFDGIWKDSSANCLVVEVKTTDAYRINLDTLIGYRDRLAEEGKIRRNDPVLVVVGREDTGDFEAQVRGSRHAWDVRIISVDSLLKLCKVRLKTEVETHRRIESILRPIEYTRLDQIIDLMFAAVTETEEDQVDEINRSSAAQRTSIHQDRTAPEDLEITRSKILSTIESKTGLTLVRDSRAKYKDIGGALRVVCTISKVYEDNGLWYAYHPKWDIFLSECANGVLALGIATEDFFFEIPRPMLAAELRHLGTTGSVAEDGYWHLVIQHRQGSYYLYRSGVPALDLMPYVRAFG
ncbi:MAG: hypothetical protein JST40_06015 [Armatimonadetes bacterium]|nr:hypothetical protein [Armatimonadota bacterium]